MTPHTTKNTGGRKTVWVWFGVVVIALLGCSVIAVFCSIPYPIPERTQYDDIFVHCLLRSNLSTFNTGKLFVSTRGPKNPGFGNPSQNVLQELNRFGYTVCPISRLSFFRRLAGELRDPDTRENTVIIYCKIIQKIDSGRYKVSFGHRTGFAAGSGKIEILRREDTCWRTEKVLHDLTL